MQDSEGLNVTKSGYLGDIASHNTLWLCIHTLYRQNGYSFQTCIMKFEEVHTPKYSHGNAHNKIIELLNLLIFIN